MKKIEQKQMTNIGYEEGEITENTDNRKILRGYHE